MAIIELQFGEEICQMSFAKSRGDICRSGAAAFRRKIDLIPPLEAQPLAATAQLVGSLGCRCEIPLTETMALRAQAPERRDDVAVRVPNQKPADDRLST